jgi:hypothetical protein
MKKALITLTILLMSACVSKPTAELIDSGKIYVGMDKQKFVYAILPTEWNENPFRSDCYRYYFPNLKKEVLSSKSRSKYYVFENVTKPAIECSSLTSIGDGILAKILDSIPEVEKYVGEKIIVKEVVKTPEIKKEVKAEVKKENIDTEKSVVKKKKGTGTTVWKKQIAKSEFYGTSEIQIVSNWVKSDVPLKFPYQDLKARMIYPCGATNLKDLLVYIEFSSRPNLIEAEDNRYNFKYDRYMINVKADGLIYTATGKMEFHDVFFVIDRFNIFTFPILTAQKLTYEFKQYAGLGYYTFDMTDFPEKCF